MAGVTPWAHLEKNASGCRGAVDACSTGPLSRGFGSGGGVRAAGRGRWAVLPGGGGSRRGSLRREAAELSGTGPRQARSS
jgi:hypothetical protein